MQIADNETPPDIEMTLYSLGDTFELPAGNIHDQISFKKPSTLQFAALYQIAAEATGLFKEYNVTINDFSCRLCGAKKNCPFAFDFYNTNGDCLAEK